MYNRLSKYFHISEAAWKDEYQTKFNGASAKKLDFYLHEYNHKEEFQLFYVYTEEIALLISQIFKAHNELSDILATMPHEAKMQFSQNCLMNEIRCSNDIEGVKSSRRDIRQAYVVTKPKRYIRLWGIVNKYKEILSKSKIALSSCKDIRQLYDDFILQDIIRVAKSDKPDGKLFRKEGVDVVTASQKIIHRGAEPEAKIISSLNFALQLLEDETVPALIRIAIFHYLFGYIHPFYDGNGRMGRFITSYLLSKEIDITVALRLSLMIKKNKNKYYAAFKEANSYRNAGDITPFIIDALSLILAAEKNTINVLTTRMKKFNRLRRACEMLTYNMDKLTQDICYNLLQVTIFSNGGITIAELAKILGKTERTIRDRIADLPSDYVRIITGEKPYRYKLRMGILHTTARCMIEESK